MCREDNCLLGLVETAAVVDAEVSRTVGTDAQNGTSNFTSRTAVGVSRCEQMWKRLVGERRNLFGERQVGGGWR